MIAVIPYWKHRFIYLGWETSLDTQAKLPPRCQQFWFLEDSPPYSLGNGWRLRLGNDFALHLGAGIHRPNTSSTEESLGGYQMPVDPTEIAEWGIDAHIHETEPAEPDSPETAEGEK